MPIQPTAKIWHNGNLIPWDKAQIHVMSHVVHYGSSVFEGIRCYAQPSGAAVFRLPEHMQRLLDSAKIYRMPTALFARPALRCGRRCSSRPTGSRPATSAPSPFAATAKSASTPRARPSRSTSPTSPGANMSRATAAPTSASPVWNRPAPNTMPSLAKAGGNYLNSQLIRMEAEINGYVEGIALDVNGYLSRRLRRKPLRRPQRRHLHHAAGQLRALRHHPRLGAHPRPPPRHPGRRAGHAPRAALHRRRSLLHRNRRRSHAHPLRRPHHRRRRQPGPITRQLADEFFGIANGLRPDRFGWLTPVNVNVEQPVSV